MRLRIAGGTLVSPLLMQRADVVCEGGQVTAIISAEERTPVDDMIDATGRLVFPGFIDPHVHTRDPGQTDKEEFELVTQAAAVGGVTAICEMPNTLPPVTDVATFERRINERAGRAHVDFAQWIMGLGADNLGGLRQALAAGAVGVKIFWGYGLNRETGALVYNADDVDPATFVAPPTAGDVYRICAEVAPTGGLVAAHCEDPAIIRAAEAALGKRVENYDELLSGRPALAEASAVAVAAEISRATGCRFRVLHIASRRALEIVRGARAQRVPIVGETCPQYLSFSAEDFRRRGTAMKVYPPIGTSDDRAALWSALADGTIDSVGSDHAPHTMTEKALPLHRQPAGVAGIQTLVPVMLSAMSRGQISPQRLAAVLSENTARNLGLFPMKGAISVGSDADFTIVDPQAEQVIDQGALRHKLKLSPWNGESLCGRPVRTIVRSHTVMLDGEIIGSPIGRVARSRAAGGDVDRYVGGRGGHEAVPEGAV